MIIYVLHFVYELIDDDQIDSVLRSKISRQEFLEFIFNSRMLFVIDQEEKNENAERVDVVVNKFDAR
jgi:hypothetical protein